MRTICAFISFLLFSITAFADEVVRGQDHFQFTYHATCPEITGHADMWLPIATSDAFQTVTIQKSSLPNNWRKIEDGAYHNQIALVRLDSTQSGKPIEVVYDVVRREKATYPAGDDAAHFLHAERLVPVGETFATIAREATNGKKTDLERGRALYQHVLARMKYDKTGTGWGRGDANYACDARKGNCTDFHSYFIALARSIGIPARFAIGFTIPPEKDDGEISGYHCWAEFFADGKWIPIDISEAWKAPALADYYFGHHPANRFEVSRGRDLLTDPAPASGPVNFLVYPLLEVDGKPVKMETAFTFHRIKTGQTNGSQSY